MIMNGSKEMREALFKKEQAHECPVCEQSLFPCKGSFLICKICGWEDDNIQYDDHDYEGGANELSVNQYKKWWADWQRNNTSG